MFETVVPETYVKRSKRVFYETLPVSLAVHALAVAGVLLGTVWNVAFPQNSPNLIAAYSLTSLPDPPPPPPPPAVMEPAPKTPAPKVDAPPPPPQMLEMAPRVIPNLVPHVEIPPPLPLPPPPKVASAEGVPGGDPNGSKDGKIGGHGKGLAFSLVFPDDGRVYVDRDTKLPLVPVKQEYPHYPDDMRKKHIEDSVLVRYVIGTNGRVKDVTILDHARQPVFDEATVNAIKDWSFRPLKKEGKAVEVVHELTVFYQLVTH